LHFALPETRHIELWNKQTGQWTLGPEQTEARAYHSTALLLPDGRVMSAGDESNGDGDPAHVDTAEIYEPPYLHKGPRPQIASVSDQIQTGAGFGVTTPDTNIAGASLVAPGAVTHGVDMNQRVIQLDVTHGTGCVSVRAPTANVAPPGYYMLFLLNDQGVPSVSKFVKLQASASPDACDATPPSAPGAAAHPEADADAQARADADRPDAGARALEALEREVPQGRGDDDQLPPQRGREGEPVGRGETEGPQGPRPLHQAGQSQEAQLLALRARARRHDVQGRSRHEPA